MKASELRAQLTEAGMTKDDVDRIVKSRVEAEAVENDEEASTNVDLPDPALVDAFVDKIKKGLEQDDGQANLFDDLGTTGDEYVTSGGDDIDGLFKAMAQATDDAHARTDRVVKALSGGIVGLAEQNAQLIKAIGVLVQTQGAVDGRLDSIEKALKKPVKPRALTGLLQAVPSPSDEAAAAQAGGGNRAELHDKYQAKALSELKKAKSAGDADRMDLMKAAIKRFDEIGSDPAGIAAEYGLA